jgi:hypothetical protein
VASPRLSAVLEVDINPEDRRGFRPSFRNLLAEIPVDNQIIPLGVKSNASELLLKLEIRISPRTLRPYLHLANAFCERPLGTLGCECLGFCGFRGKAGAIPG